MHMRVLADRSSGRVPAGPDGSEQRTVVVIGAGITGLVAAYELRRRGLDVMLYEASRQAGGNLRTSSVDGFLAEHGAQSFVRTQELDDLISRLGLSDDVVECAPNAQRTYLARDNRLHLLPHSLPSLVRSRLLSAKARLRLLFEPFIPRNASELDESVGSFVSRRCGREMLDYIVAPIIRSSCGGDVMALSMAQLFPREHRLERKYGSLGRSLLEARFRSRRLKPDGIELPATRAVGFDSKVASFRDGMQTLPNALERALKGAVRLNCPARLLHRHDARWVIEAGPDGVSKTHTVDAVILAVPAHGLTAMELPAEVRRYAGSIEHVEHPPVSTLTLGFRREDILHPFGAAKILVPESQCRTVSGVQINSAMFPGRAPEGHVTITCMAGGTGAPDIARLDTNELVDRTISELAPILGVRGYPVFRKHVHWVRGVPQMSVGFSEVKRAADAVELLNPGLYLAGSFRSGQLVGQCVEGGQQVAHRVATYLTRAG